MLEASQLSKSYGSRRAVADLSLTLNPGEIVGLLGPNGAGKSSTIGMLAGLLAPDGGSVSFKGMTLATRDGADGRQVRRHIGLVPQDIAIFEELSARVNLETFGALYGLTGKSAASRIGTVLDEVGLAARADEPTARFSGGMKRRLNIAAALLHNPDVVLLDEPTVGVDPQSRNAIFGHLEALRAAGKALVYSTHYMEEAERLCDRVIIIDHGRVVASGTPAELFRLLPASHEVTLTVGAEYTIRAIEALSSWQARAVAQNDEDIVVRISDMARDLPAIVDAIRQAAVPMRAMETHRIGLEALFLQLTGRALRDEDEGADKNEDGRVQGDAK